MTITDVTVSIAVKKASSVSGFGIPAIFVSGETNDYKEYTTLEAVQLDFQSGTSTYKFAQTFFKQQGHPHYLAVIVFSDLAAAYQQYQNKPWYFAVLANEAITAAHPQNDDKVLALSNLIEESEYRLMIVLDKYGAADKLTSAKTLLGGIAGNDRTVLLVTKESSDSSISKNRLDAALLGTYGARVIGSLNWHDLSLKESADDWDAVSLSVIDQAGVIAYVNKANNIAQTTSGKTVSGLYIDQLMGIDWVTQNILMRLQDVLTNNDKVPFTAGGIALLQSVVEDVLDQAYVNGIVDVDDKSGNPLYTVSARPRSEMQASEVANRIYSGLSFNYTPSGAVDRVNVTGSIEI